MNPIAFGRDVLGDPARARDLEWLVTNGIGGYAAGTVSGQLTRRYHGLLFAALKPPLGRTLLLAKLAERIELDDRSIELDTDAWSDGSVAPCGCVHLESFRLEDTVPVWTWAIGDVRLEKRVWMEHGENTTYVQYRLAAAPGPVRLALRAMVNHRDSHDVTQDGAHEPRVEPATGGLRVEMFEGATPLWLLAVNAEFHPRAEWYRHYALAVETERGLEDVEDHLCAGEMVTRLKPGEMFTVIASTRRDAGAGEAAALVPISALLRRRAHEKGLIESWRIAHPATSRHAPAWVRQLVLAADQFVVERSTLLDPHGQSVIAGYPWFSDWGRDTMISLPGLALVTGRPEVARAVLGTYARFVDGGMLPNMFPDSSEAPVYNTVDAALWLFQAVRAFHDATGDDAFLAEMMPALEQIVHGYEEGTRFGIGVDPMDGLVRQGVEGVALTWMDAVVEGDVITPRHGKPVEINALWYNAQTTMIEFARRLKKPVGPYEVRAARVAESFLRFWNPTTGCLYDVLDGPEGNDPRIRPNQIFAVSLPHSPIDPARRRAIVDACGRWLLTSHGLRTLAPHDPDFRPTMAGTRRERDSSYHNGTVWTWLLPHFALAHERVYADRLAARAFLEPMSKLICEMGLGSLPEVADGEAPHRPRGCFAQAWSVAETLRAWHALSGERPRPIRKRNGRGIAASRRPGTRPHAL